MSHKQNWLDFDMKMKLINTLYQIGFKKETIVVVLHRIEIFDEDIGLALFKTLLDVEESKIVEAKEEID